MAPRADLFAAYRTYWTAAILPVTSRVEIPTADVLYEFGATAPHSLQPDDG